MLKNYILLTLRTLKRQKVTSFIAIMGLAIGIAGFLLLLLYIDYQKSFDDFIPEDSVKRLISKRVDKELEVYYCGTDSISQYTTRLIKDNVPSIKEYTRYNVTLYCNLEVDNEVYHETISFVDSNFFNIIPFKVVKGDKNELLSDPYSIVLDRPIAEKLYPDGDALGKTVIYRTGTNDLTLRVTGVVEVPKKSHLNRDESQVFIPHKLSDDLFFNNSVEGQKDYWTGVYFTTESKTSSENLLDELKNLSTLVPYYNEYKSVDIYYEEFQDIYLHSKEYGSNPTNPYYMIVIIFLLTLALIIISIINTISILTAQSITRTKEVGVRLVMGSDKSDLKLQFLTESITISSISLILALVLAELLLPAFNNLVAIPLEINYNFSLILSLLLLTLFIGIISGLYPAFYLSSLRVVESLKGKNLLKLGKARKILVVIQFFISSILLICTLCFNNEVEYLKKMDVGFNRENIIQVYPGDNFNSEPKEKLATFRHRALKIDGVKKLSYTGYSPWLGGMLYYNKYTNDEIILPIYEDYFYVDKNYLNLMEVEVISGDIKTDFGVIISESVNRYRKLEIGDSIKIDSKAYPLVAIINDYYLHYPTDRYKGIINIVGEEDLYFCLIKIIPGTDIKQIKDLWKSIFPHRGFDYGFVEESIEKGITDDNIDTLIKLLNITTILTLFLTALGLFGLILHTIKQKTKDIGVRKVLGATTINIVLHFLRESITLIIIAVILGLPTGILITKRALIFVNYPFPVHNLLKLSTITISALLIFGTLFIGSMVIKAAMANPSKALRYE